VKYQEQRAVVARYALEMEERGLTQFTSGNVSMRVSEGAIITPSTMPYADIRPEDCVLMDLEGNVLEGERQASVEHKVHLACYKHRESVQGVIHSHPLYATAFAAARVPLPAFLDEFGVYVGAEVRCAEYAMSGSPDIAENLVKALSDDTNAAFIASHGMVTVGRSLDEAMRVARMVERAAQIFLYARILGAIVEPPEESKTLFRQVFSYFQSQPPPA
jgi:L-fuculose-phosphate aldolase